jgi:hypothetical protein
VCAFLLKVPPFSFTFPEISTSTSLSDRAYNSSDDELDKHASFTRFLNNSNSTENDNNNNNTSSSNTEVVVAFAGMSSDVVAGETQIPPPLQSASSSSLLRRHRKKLSWSEADFSDVPVAGTSRLVRSLSWDTETFKKLHRFLRTSIGLQNDGEQEVAFAGVNVADAEKLRQLQQLQQHLLQRQQQERKRQELEQQRQQQQVESVPQAQPSSAVSPTSSPTSIIKQRTSSSSTQPTDQRRSVKFALSEVKSFSFEHESPVPPALAVTSAEWPSPSTKSSSRDTADEALSLPIYPPSERERKHKSFVIPSIRFAPEQDHLGAYISCKHHASDLQAYHNPLYRLRMPTVARIVRLPGAVIYKQHNGLWCVRRATRQFLLDSFRYAWSEKNVLYVDTLLFTVQMWCGSHEEFLDRIIEVYYSTAAMFNLATTPVTRHAASERDSELTRMRVVNALRRWLEQDLDREYDQRIIRRLLMFAEVLLASGGSHKHYGKKLMTACLALNDVVQPSISTSSPRLVLKERSLLSRLRLLSSTSGGSSGSPLASPTASPTSSPSQSQSSFAIPARTITPTSATATADGVTLRLVELDMRELAEHLTACDWRTFRRIRMFEFLVQSWNGEQRETAAPNLLSLVNTFNRMTNWIATEILLTPDSEQRAHVIERFIDLAQAFRQLNNFHGLVQVFAALNLLCVQKLTVTWQSVSRKHIDTVRSLEQLLDSQHNWQQYRRLVESIDSAPFIPFEGVFLSDITGIQENVDEVDGQINVDKLTMLGRAFQVIKRSQLCGYPLQINQTLSAFIENTTVLDEDQLWQLSLKVRAREGDSSFSFFATGDE